MAYEVSWLQWRYVGYVLVGVVATVGFLEAPWQWYKYAYTHSTRWIEEKYYIPQYPPYSSSAA